LKNYRKLIAVVAVMQIICMALAGCDLAGNNGSSGYPNPCDPKYTELATEISAPEAIAEEISAGRQTDLYDRFDDAVISIFSDGETEDERFFVGSGFTISEDGMAITAAHVLKGAYEPWAKLADGTWVEIAGTYVYDTASDTAVIQLQKEFAPYPYLEIEGKDNVSIGDPVYVIGAPQDEYAFFSSGTVKEMKYLTYSGNEINADVINITADIWKGNSGCPIVNESGKAISFASASTPDSKGGHLVNISVNIVIFDFNAIAEMRVRSIAMSQINDKNGKPSKPILLTAN